MPDITHYKNTFRKKKAQFNKDSQLEDYFGPLIGEKKSVYIAELAAGPVNTIGNTWPGVEVKIQGSDVEWPRYAELWGDDTPIVPIEYQDMEKLTYEDNTFDIVHCRNALDHTNNPLRAIEEMKRVTKRYIYLLHAEGQKRIYGGHHTFNWEDVELDGFKTVRDGKWIKQIFDKYE